MRNETSLAQKTKIEQSFYTFLEIMYLEVRMGNVLDVFYKAVPSWYQSVSNLPPNCEALLVRFIYYLEICNLEIPFLFSTIKMQGSYDTLFMFYMQRV